jgi:tetrahydromethanopterin S-methyltransferase subunit G
MSEATGKIPSVITDPVDFNAVIDKLNIIDEKIEFVSSEVAQRIGKKVGRDIGILYGGVTGIVLFLLYILFLKPALGI